MMYKMFIIDNKMVLILFLVYPESDGSGDYSDILTGDSEDEIMPSRPAAGNTDGETIRMSRHEQKDARGKLGYTGSYVMSLVI